MARTVFILGAGASRHTGAPLMNDFLDKAEDLLWEKKLEHNEELFRKVFEAIAKLRGIYAKTNLSMDNIEDVFSIFEMSKTLSKLGDLSPEKIEELYNSIKVFIAVTLEETILFDSGQSNPGYQPTSDYLAFALLLKDLEKIHKKRDSKLRSSIITFNYDLALELSLHNQTINYKYCLSDEVAEQGYPILKLHGSLNWGRCKYCKKTGFNDVFGNNYRYSLGSKIPFQGHPEDIICKNCNKMIGEKEPDIIPPSWNKITTSANIKNVWKKAAEELHEAKEIVVIGYSLPETDLFFKYLFALGTDSSTRIEKFIVCDPDPKVGEKFSKLLGKGITNRFKYVEYDFNHAIGELKVLFNIDDSLARLEAMSTL